MAVAVAVAEAVAEAVAVAVAVVVVVVVLWLSSLSLSLSAHVRASVHLLPALCPPDECSNDLELGAGSSELKVPQPQRASIGNIIFFIFNHDQHYRDPQSHQSKKLGSERQS